MSPRLDQIHCEATQSRYSYHVDITFSFQYQVKKTEWFLKLLLQEVLA